MTRTIFFITWQLLLIAFCLLLINAILHMEHWTWGDLLP